jgi:hypothetical protein
MLILIAALIQAAPGLALDPDPVEAALTCQRATMAERQTLPLDVSMQFSYFTMLAARALPGDGDYFQRMAALVSNSEVQLSGDNLRRIRELCDRRYPLARATGPAALPADAFARDMMCASVVSVFGGIARGYGERTGDAAPFRRLQAIAARYQPRAAAGMVARGTTGRDAQRRAMGDHIFASLDLGNPAAIADACEAQPEG